MTTKKARDFLDKEIFVNNHIVTFRSLSRELGIHVDDAKNELQLYYDAVRNTDSPAVATYLVSGEVPALNICHKDTPQSDFAMDLDLEFEEDVNEDVDVVCQSKVLLVDARMLDETKAQFSRVFSVHVYSLSPSRFGDAGFVCIPSFKVHQADARGGPDSFSVVGKMTGSHVKLKLGAVYKSTASSSKTTLDVSARMPPKRTASIKTEQQATKGKGFFPSTEEHGSTTPLVKAEFGDRPKPLGKLDWSKAKTKEKGKEPATDKTKEDKKPKLELKPSVTACDPLASKKRVPEPTKPVASKAGSSSVTTGNAQKRGIKRKPRLDTDLESESEALSVRAKPSPAGGFSSKKGVVGDGDGDSDEDDGSDTQVRKLGHRRLQRKSTVASDSEKSLCAMMDIDDEHVNRVSRLSIGKVRPQPEEEEESSEHEKEATAPPATSEGEESDDVPIVPQKRKPRKVVPVGRNGLRKRRVVKSRTTTDAKGYMQTEDYSSYESVEEEEAPVKPRGKGKETKKGAEPKVEETKPKVTVKERSVAGKPNVRSGGKPRGGGAAKRGGGLLNFFGPESGKK